MITKPDCIYTNKKGRKGSYLFSKVIKNTIYVCILEVDREDIHIVSSFVTGDKYLSKFTLLWS
jgi:hypothetical protein